MTEETHQFFQLGSQYYLAGRYGVFAWLHPVVGNLMHHAIEMYLKGALARTKTLSDLRRFNHRIDDTWEILKAEQKDDSLVRFDPVITRLNAYEEIRYPDKILESGMSSTITPTRAAAAMAQGAGSADVPQYHLCLEEIDDLVATIFRIASRNPDVYLRSMTEDAATYMNRDNAHINTSI